MSVPPWLPVSEVPVNALYSLYLNKVEVSDQVLEDLGVALSTISLSLSKETIECQHLFVATVIFFQSIVTI